MTETLIPFDPEIAVKHPERVRHINKPDKRACWAYLESPRVLIQWLGSGGLVSQYSAEDLRLTTPTKTVMVQCYQNGGAIEFAAVGDKRLNPACWQPIGDPFEVSL